MGKNLLISRYCLAVVLCISAFVVLGISVNVENASQSSATVLKKPNLSGTVAGAITVMLEAMACFARFSPRAVPNRLIVEIGLLGSLWTLWLAAAISVTVFTEDRSGFCKNLANLRLDPDLSDLDSAALATIKATVEPVCSRLQAEMAFTWICVVLITIAVLVLSFTGLSKQRRLGKSVWATSLRELGGHK